MPRYFIGPDVSGQATIRAFTGDFALQEVKPENFFKGGNAGGGKSEYQRLTLDQYLEANKPNLYKELTQMKITKKFYVGSRTMIDGSRNNWAHSTLNAAIDHAKELCDESDEDQIVVQIVRVVKRSKSPISVEKV